MKFNDVKIGILFNIIPEFPANNFNLQSSPMGGWLMSMVEELVKYGITVDIISPYEGKEIKFTNDGKINYYIIPKKDNYKFWEEYLFMEKPQIIHVNGTEMSYSEPLFEIDHSSKIIVSIQGIVSEIKNYVYGNISQWDIIKNLSLKEIVRGTTLFSQKRFFSEQGKYEQEVLKKADYIIGRTDWDRSFISNLGYRSKYRHVNENLRNGFYSSPKWNYKKTTPYSIFVSQGAQAYKGVDQLFKALEIVKKEYPNVMVNIAGYKPVNNKSLKDKLLLSTYGKYLIKIIKEKNLKDNINFIGLLNESEMINAYLDSNIYIQTSLIENSPNSLGEALILGVPSIASYVGGTSDFVENNVNGILFNSNDSMYLAAKIIELFSDISLCEKFSEKAIEKSIPKYDRKKNALDLIKVYKESIKEMI